MMRSSDLVPPLQFGSLESILHAKYVHRRQLRDVLAQHECLLRLEGIAYDFTLKRWIVPEGREQVFLTVYPEISKIREEKATLEASIKAREAELACARNVGNKSRVSHLKPVGTRLVLVS